MAGRGAGRGRCSAASRCGTALARACRQSSAPCALRLRAPQQRRGPAWVRLLSHPTGMGLHHVELYFQGLQVPKSTMVDTGMAPRARPRARGARGRRARRVGRAVHEEQRGRQTRSSACPSARPTSRTKATARCASASASRAAAPWRWLRRRRRSAAAAVAAALRSDGQEGRRGLRPLRAVVHRRARGGALQARRRRPCEGSRRRAPLTATHPRARAQPLQVPRVPLLRARAPAAAEPAAAAATAAAAAHAAAAAELAAAAAGYVAYRVPVDSDAAVGQWRAPRPSTPAASAVAMAAARSGLTSRWRRRCSARSSSAACCCMGRCAARRRVAQKLASFGGDEPPARLGR